jgi:hypothetical protein
VACETKYSLVFQVAEEGCCHVQSACIVNVDVVFCTWISLRFFLLKGGLKHTGSDNAMHRRHVALEQLNNVAGTAGESLVDRIDRLAPVEVG